MRAAPFGELAGSEVQPTRDGLWASFPCSLLRTCEKCGGVGFPEILPTGGGHFVSPEKHGNIPRVAGSVPFSSGSNLLAGVDNPSK